MPTIFSHAIAAAAIGTVVAPNAHMPRRFWVLGAVASMAPDADVIAFGFGLPYEHVFGHRGITHSPLFAAIVAAALVFGAFGGESWRIHRGRLWLYFALVTASHGWLDAMTTGGRGVAFLAPFSAERFFLPWRPILVSPIGARFFSARGLAVIQNEMAWLWLPCAAVAVTSWLLRARARAT